MTALANPYSHSSRNTLESPRKVTSGPKPMRPLPQSQLFGTTSPNNSVLPNPIWPRASSCCRNVQSRQRGELFEWHRCHDARLHVVVSSDSALLAAAAPVLLVVGHPLAA
jgi:hypothetical protein